jgi:hypothetical protein
MLPYQQDILEKEYAANKDLSALDLERSEQTGLTARQIKVH